MKNSIYFLLIFLAFSCKEIKEDVFLIENLLPSGLHQYEVISASEDPELLELAAKFQKAIKENFDWFIQYSENKLNREASGRLKYHEKLGLTISEQDRMMELFDEISYEVIDSSSVKVVNEGGFITFYHEDGGNFLNFLEINTNQNNVIFDTTFLEFDSYTKIMDTNNAFKASWEGVTWSNSKEDTLKIKDLTMKKIESLEFNSYVIKFGKLIESDRIFLIIKIKEVENGEIGSFEYRVLFK